MSRAVAVFDGDLRLIFINQAAIDLLELPEELAEYGTLMKPFLFHQAKHGAFDVNDFEEEYRRRVGTPRLQTEFTRNDGTTVRVQRDPLDNGGFVVLYTDVTEQRRAEAALQRSELRYRSIVEDQAEQILRCSPDGIITFVNAACCQFQGTGRVDLIGLPAANLVHDEDRDHVAAFFFRGTHRHPTREIEHRAWRGDGELRWLHRRDRAILNNEGEVVEFQSVARDVTDIRNAESQVRQASALAILGQMSAGVTHELNQPLNAASMGVQNLLMQMEESSDPVVTARRDKLEKVLGRLRRMGEIVNHLRSFIQSNAHGHACADLAGIIETSVDLVRHQLTIDDIDVRIAAPSSLSPVLGDKVQLEIVFTNLLSNAHAAILRQRRKQAGAAPPRGAVDIVVDQRSDAVEIRVTDNGGGIPPDVIDRIFDPFFTTQEIGRGMGLGLSLVYRIVTGLKGSIIATNAAEGAVFTLMLPIAEEEGWI
ncbi:MAG: PAS domain S-box protein [Alphaproteobacteria bacterium]|nr:PAS domain S-box protein [Alphaproteobacteria bacterium]